MNINNIFKKISAEKEVFYDAVEYQDIHIDEVFKAEYNYGPQEEQILKKNIIINFFQTLIARLFQQFLYPGSSKKLDKQRVLKTKHQLKAIGGKSVALKTPDGDTIEGVYLKASDFRASIEKYFYVFKERNAPYNSSEKFLALRNKFCVEEQKGSVFSYTHLTPNEEAKQFIEHLEGLKFTNLSSEAPLPYREKIGISTTRKTIDYLQSFLVHKVRGYHLPLYSLPREINQLPSIDEERTSNPTVIISGGNNTIYGSYKDLAAHYLMRGLDVMMVNPRGYGDSTGIPTSHKTKLDLETAYQYLSKEKGVENKDLLLHGHCIGGGLSTDLAARRKGINILVDRSFANIANIIKKDIDKFIDEYLIAPLNQEAKLGKIQNKIVEYIKDNEIAEKLSNLITKIISSSVNYDNTTNLNKVEGNIAVVLSTNDLCIPKDEIKAQINNERTIIVTSMGHGPLWINKGEKDMINELTPDPETSKKFNEFLIKCNLYRKVF